MDTLVSELYKMNGPDYIIEFRVSSTLHGQHCAVHTHQIPSDDFQPVTRGSEENKSVHKFTNLDEENK